MSVSYRNRVTYIFVGGFKKRFRDCLHQQQKMVCKKIGNLQNFNFVDGIIIGLTTPGALNTPTHKTFFASQNILAFT